MMLKDFAIIIGIGLVCGFVAGQANATVMYPPQVGNDVTYSQISEASADPANDPEPLFGNPSDPTNPEIIGANTLDFDPSANAFSADAPPPETTDGSLVFLVTSNDGSNLDQVTFKSSGDYQFFGFQPSGEFVGDTINVSFKDPDTEDTLSNTNDNFFQGFTTAPAQQGNFQVDISTSIANLQTDSILVELDNTLSASSTSGSTASIRKKDFQATFTTVPEPATAVLFGLGSVLVISGRRKRTA